jgi:2-C-methyl-D-erythritol 4-phosphate cytidylyltransferase
MKLEAVVVAGGSGTRFGANKLLALLDGRPVLAWSIMALLSVDEIERVVVAGPQELADCVAAISTSSSGKPVELIAGGARRRDSVEAGLRACASRYVAIHDGARPLIEPADVAKLIAAAEGKPGAILATPVTDTVKEVAGDTIVAHPERSRLWAAQTPQVVLRQAWLDAAAMSDNDETDDAAMLDRLGLQCRVVDSGSTNLKITRPWDITVAEAILRERGKA